MARVIRSTEVETSDGRTYAVQICGRQLDGGRWEGWIEFAPADASPALRTPRETTQPTLGALDHWASGLTPVYLDGALTRAVHATRIPHVEVDVPAAPYYDEPAPDPHATAVEAPARRQVCEPNDFVDVDGAVLDPLSVYAKGEDHLRQKLAVLSADHLRRIARGYALVSPDLQLDGFTEPALVELIMAGVRVRCAA